MSSDTPPRMKMERQHLAGLPAGSRRSILGEIEKELIMNKIIIDVIIVRLALCGGTGERAVPTLR